MVTGLIQTPAYARQALSWPEERSPAAVEEIVNHKVRRQAILHRETDEWFRPYAHMWDTGHCSS